MLVLERKQGEGLTLFTSTGEIIQIELIISKQDRAKIGVKAPAGVVVVRDELLQPAIDHVATEVQASSAINYQYGEW